MDEKEILSRTNSLYLEIIMRYKEHIEKSENLYVADLPKLITPGDGSVLEIATKIKANFPVYDYEENFYDAAKLAFDYVKENIATVEIPVQIWLYPSDTLKSRAGDLFDRATLLCSLLIALGNSSSRVVVSTNDAKRSIVIYSQTALKVLLLDLESEISEYPNVNLLLEKVLLRGSEANSYEFNDKVFKNLD